MTKEELDKFNQEHSPKILLRMGWSYYDTESAARRVAEFSGNVLMNLLDYVRGMGERPPTLYGVKEQLQALLK
jgi:hypothetical protein